jgi:hypothetical protein
MAEAIFPLFIFTAGNYFNGATAYSSTLIYINEFTARLFKTA